MLLPSFLSDVSTLCDTVANELDKPTARGALWQAAPGRFLLDLPGVARYLVVDGNSVTIDQAVDAVADAVTRFFRMTPLAALIFQRGMLAMHASAVCSEKGVILLAGDSGSGKSSLLAHLLNQGYMMLADDLAVVDVDDVGQPIVFPTYPEIALWPDTVEGFGMKDALLPQYDCNRKSVVMPDSMATCSRPLLAIYWIRVNRGDALEIATLTGADKFQALGMLSYNTHVADALLDRVNYLRLATQLASRIPLHKLQRPRSGCSLEELAAVVTKDL